MRSTQEVKVIDKTFKDHHGFVVHTESFYPKGIEAARYIGRYLDHPPLATSHLTDYDGKTVTFWYTKCPGRALIPKPGYRRKCDVQAWISFL